VDHDVTFDRDAFHFQLTAAHLRKLTTTLSERAKSFDMIDTFSQPLNWRLPHHGDLDARRIQRHLGGVGWQ
jgi:hypothetical protein